MNAAKERYSSLLPIEIPWITGYTDKQEIDSLISTCHAWLTVADDTSRWVRKSSRYAGHENIMAEAFCYLLGSQCGAPIPRAARHDDREEFSWFSSFVQSAQPWASEMCDAVLNLQALGSTIVLDAVVGIGSRHRDNLLAEPVEGSGFMLRAIDFGDASVRDAASLDDLGSGTKDPHRSTCRGLPLRSPALLEGVESAAAAMALLTTDTLEAYAQLAIEVAGWKPGSIDPAAVYARCQIADQLAADLIRKLGDL